MQVRDWWGTSWRSFSWIGWESNCPILCAMRMYEFQLFEFGFGVLLFLFGFLLMLLGGALLMYKYSTLLNYYYAAIRPSVESQDSSSFLSYIFSYTRLLGQLKNLLKYRAICVSSEVIVVRISCTYFQEDCCLFFLVYFLVFFFFFVFFPFGFCAFSFIARHH